MKTSEEYIASGLAYSYKGNPDKAIECYNKAIEKKMDNAEAYYNMGNAYRDKGEYDEAIEYFKQAIKLKSNYIKDRRIGDFTTYFPGNKIEMKGIFESNVMQGEWIYYDENGAIKTKIIYHNGVPQNATQLEEQEQKYFRMIEENKGKIPEPDETNMFPMKQP